MLIITVKYSKLYFWIFRILLEKYGILKYGLRRNSKIFESSEVLYIFAEELYVGPINIYGRQLINNATV